MGPASVPAVLDASGGRINPVAVSPFGTTAAPRELAAVAGSSITVNSAPDGTN